MASGFPKSASRGWGQRRAAPLDTFEACEVFTRETIGRQDADEGGDRADRECRTVVTDTRQHDFWVEPVAQDQGRRDDQASHKLANEAGDMEQRREAQYLALWRELHPVTGRLSVIQNI